jgi:hypothetical protein
MINTPKWLRVEGDVCVHKKLLISSTIWRFPCMKEYIYIWMNERKCYHWNNCRCFLNKSFDDRHNLTRHLCDFKKRKSLIKHLIIYIVTHLSSHPSWTLLAYLPSPKVPSYIAIVSWWIIFLALDCRCLLSTQS